MELQPSAPASVPGCRNQLVGVRTRYRNTSFQGRQNGDVGIERRQHAVSGAHCTSLMHISTNFQATSAAERAFDILDAGGVLSIKAHITKNVPGHTHLDGVDDLYMNYLDRLFEDIEVRYGETINWTTLGQLATSLTASSARLPSDMTSSEIAADRAA